MVIPTIQLFSMLAIELGPANIIAITTIAISILALIWSLIVLRDVLTSYSMAAIIMVIASIIVFIIATGLLGFSLKSIVAGALSMIIIIAVSSIFLLVDIFIMYKVYKIGKAIKVIISKSEKVKSRYMRLKNDIEEFMRRIKPLQETSSDLLSKIDDFMKDYHIRKTYEW